MSGIGDGIGSQVRWPKGASDEECRSRSSSDRKDEIFKVPDEAIPGPRRGAGLSYLRWLHSLVENLSLM